MSYTKTAIDNGLRLVSCPMKDRDSVALGFWVGAGGRYEQDREKGSAHFLEHILFKGSKLYSCREIKELIEGVGGALNAFTSEEQTCYYAKIPARHFQKTFDILADMVFFPSVKTLDVRKEKGVILEEIKMYRDLPQYHVLERLDALMWPDHPLGKSIAGSAETVSGLEARDLKNFHKAHYNPGNVVVAACGDVSHRQLCSLVKKKLGAIKGKGRSAFTPFTGKTTKARVDVVVKPIEQMHVALGMHGYSERDPKRFALVVLGVLLGGNMSSRLFNEVREKRGLAYSISSSAKSFHDTGAFIVRAGVDNSKIVGAIDVILKELDKAGRDIKDGEFTRSKEYIVGQLQIALEDTMDHMLWIGEGLVAKDELRDMKRTIAEYRKLTLADVKAAARDVLAKNRMSLAIVGPLEGKDRATIEGFFAL